MTYLGLSRVHRLRQKTYPKILSLLLIVLTTDDENINDDIFNKLMIKMKTDLKQFLPLKYS